MKLNEEQAEQVRMQLARLRKRRDAVEAIILDKENGEQIDLMTSRNVFDSSLFSGAIFLARFLYRDREL